LENRTKDDLQQLFPVFAEQKKLSGLSVIYNKARPWGQPCLAAAIHLKKSLKNTSTAAIAALVFVTVRPEALPQEEPLLRMVPPDSIVPMELAALADGTVALDAADGAAAPADCAAGFYAADRAAAPADGSVGFDRTDAAAVDADGAVGFNGGPEEPPFRMRISAARQAGTSNSRTRVASVFFM
jgi:cytochrome c1